MAMLDNLVSVVEFSAAQNANQPDSGPNGITIAPNSGTGPNRVTGKVGNCADFNGSSQYFTVASNANLQLNSGDWSIAAWVKLDGKSNYSWIMSKDYILNGREYGLLYDVAQDKFACIIGSASGNTVEGVYSTSPTTGTWYFVVGTYKASTKDLTVCVNNGTVSHQTVSLTPGNASNAVYVGCCKDQFTSPAYFIDGVIDELAVWKRVLSSGDITDLYNSGNGRAYSYYDIPPAVGLAPIQELISGQNIPVEEHHSFILDSKLGKVLRLNDEYTYSTGGSPAFLKESNGFSVSCWIKPENNGVIVGRLNGSDDFRWYLTASTDTCTIAFKISGTVVSMSADIDIGLDEWSHLTATVRKTATNTYDGEVYIDGKFSDSFGSTSITTSGMDTTGNLTLGGIVSNSTTRFPPVSIGSFGGDWVNADNDSIGDDEDSVDDDPTEYTDTTYWKYIYADLGDWITPQYVVGVTGPATKPSGLRYRMAVKIDNHGAHHAQ